MKHVFFILSLFPVLRLGAQQNALLNSDEKIFYHAKIFTADALHPFADAVAIRDDRIVAVGTLANVKKSVSSKAVMVDLHGRFILPGFVDSHSHALSGGSHMMHANMDDSLQPVSAVAAYTRKTRSDSSAMVGNFLVINGINISLWSQLDELTAVFNDSDFADQPVLLNGSDGHTHWGNKAMMRAAALDKTYIGRLPAESRKYYGTGDGDEPNGFVADSGYTKYALAMPAQKIDLGKSAEKAMEYNNRYGITAWLDPGCGAKIKDSVMDLLETYFELATQHRLRAHVAAVVVADAGANPKPQIDKLKSLQRKYNSIHDFQVIGFKVFADGVVEYPTQTAALSVPYINNGSRGALMFDPKKFAAFATMADQSGLLVHVHAIGDRAVTETLRGFALARATNGNTGIPHTITHLQFVQPSDIPLFHKLHILASMQMLWALGDITTIDIVKPYVAPEIYTWQYPARSLLQAKATICGASDWPVSGSNPFEAIYIAETRLGNRGVLDPSQCMPRLAMLYAYTINAAKALRMEHSIGSLEPGKSADMIMVDRDVLAVSPLSFYETKILWTMFEGKIVYTAGQ